MAENLGVSDFISRFTGGGARPNLYKVAFNYPGFLSGLDKLKATYLCKAASLPDSTLGQIAVPFMGRQVKVAGDRVFNDWTVTMLNDTDFQSRKLFEKWSNAMNTHTENYGIENPKDYYADIEVHQLNRPAGDTIYSYKLYGCFPVTVDAITLGYDQNDTVEEFGVTFALNWWESYDYSGSKVTGGIPEKGGGSDGAS